jgi:hypothetical protein
MRYLFLLATLLFLSSCSDDTDCGTKLIDGVTKQLELGPQGGCFYENDNGNKTYVDRSDCAC